MAPTSSVVIAAHNAADTIADALASVRLQTVQDFEVIVVDDGSTDATAAVVEPHLADPRFRLHRQANAGPASARNSGIGLARGRYVSMLDSDDLWLPGYLESMVHALELNARAGFAFTRAWTLNRTTNRVRRGVWSAQARAVDDEDLLRSLVEANFVFTAVTVRRTVLEAIGGYDPALRTSEDYDLSLRIAREGYGSAYVPGPLCIRGDRPDSLTKSNRSMMDGKRQALAKLTADPTVPADVMPVLRKQLRTLDDALDGRGRSALRARLRHAVGGATRDWRRRRAELDRPPAEIEAAFRGLVGGPGGDRAAAATRGATARGLASTVLRGGSVATAGYAITQAISFATYLALAKLLQPSDLGTFAAGTVLVNVGFVVGESGLLAALIQRRDRLEEAFNSAFLASLVAGAAFTVLALAGAPVVGLVFHSVRIGAIAAAMAGTVALRTAVIVPSAKLSREFSFLRRGVIDPIAGLAFAVSVLIAAGAGLGAWSLVAGAYAMCAVDVITAWGLIEWRPRRQWASVAMWRELARFGRPVFGAELVRRAGTEVPVIAIGRVLGVGALGQFAYAFRVASQPFGAIVGVGAYVLLPALARIAPDDARFRAAVRRALRWICAIAFPLGLMLVPLGTPAVVLIFGAKWRLAGDGVMALGVWAAVLGLDSVGSETWKAAGRPDMLPRMHGLSLALTALFVGALVPFGLVAATVGMALSAVGVGAYALHGISRVARIPRRNLLADISPPAAAALVMATALLLTERGLVHSDHRGVALGIALLAVQATAGAALYLASLSALSSDWRRELQSLVRQLRRSSIGRAGRLAVSRP